MTRTTNGANHDHHHRHDQDEDPQRASIRELVVELAVAEESLAGGAAGPPAPTNAPAGTLEAAHERIRHLETALTTRTVIGQAQGRLMERHGITADQAFDQLRLGSSLANRKLRDLADELVQTGQEPLGDKHVHD